MDLKIVYGIEIEDETINKTYCYKMLYENKEDTEKEIQKLISMFLKDLKEEFYEKNIQADNLKIYHCADNGTWQIPLIKFKIVQFDLIIKGKTNERTKQTRQKRNTRNNNKNTKIDSKTKMQNDTIRKTMLYKRFN